MKIDTEEELLPFVYLTRNLGKLIHILLYLDFLVVSMCVELYWQENYMLMQENFKVTA